jgi:thioredoxin-like negative regulator of GroEL
MREEERQFLLTTAWLFMRHGRRERARSLFEVLLETDPRDGVAAVAYADMLVSEGLAREALEVLRTADVPSSLEHAEAVLETRALRMLGRAADADSRWRRYLESRKGASRQWIGG